MSEAVNKKSSKSETKGKGKGANVAEDEGEVEFVSANPQFDDDFIRFLITSVKQVCLSTSTAKITPAQWDKIVDKCDAYCVRKNQASHSKTQLIDKMSSLKLLYTGAMEIKKTTSGVGNAANNNNYDLETAIPESIPLLSEEQISTLLAKNKKYGPLVKDIKRAHWFWKFLNLADELWGGSVPSFSYVSDMNNTGITASSSSSSSLSGFQVVISDTYSMNRVIKDA